MCDIMMKHQVVEQNINTDGLPGYERRHYWLRGTLESPSDDDASSSIELRVRELCSPEQGTGGRVWHCSVILARWLHSMGESLLRGRRVLELGAGLGAPGLVAGLFADEVVLTDFGDVVHNLQYNVDLNTPSIHTKSQASIRAMELDWNRCDEYEEPPADVVVAAEVVYSVEMVPALVATLLRVLHPGGVCYLLQDASRTGFEEFKQSLTARGMVIKVLPIPPALSTRQAPGKSEDDNRGSDDEQDIAMDDDNYVLHMIQQ